MKRYLKIAVITVLIVCSAFLYSYIDKMVMIYDKEFDTSASLNSGIGKEMQIEQKFICRENSLDGAGIKCSVVGDVSEIEVYYALKDSKEGKILEEGTVPASEIKDGKMFKFNLNQVSDCKNKEYVWLVRVKNADENAGIGFYYEGKTEENTSLYINGERRDGTLIMKTITHRFDVETFVILLFFIVYIVVFMKFLYKLFR